MTGSSCSNTMKNRISHHEGQKGQILLITVMLLATAITVVMTIAFNATTETQVTKLEQESQKALSAAEAGLELAIKQLKISSSGAVLDYSTEVGQGIKGTAQFTTTASDVFVSPLLQQDEQYTFYMDGYTTASSFGTTYFNGNFNLLFGSEGGDCASRPIALELTRVMNDDTVNRSVVDPCARLRTTTGLLTSTTNTFTLLSTTFRHQAASIPVAGDVKIIIVRPLYSSTKLGFESVVGGVFPLQGNTLVSEAKVTGSGVTKRVKLFQSYPQIPTDFFVTSF